MCDVNRHIIESNSCYYLQKVQDIKFENSVMLQYWENNTANN